MVATATRPRVWLAGQTLPDDVEVVTDDWSRTWVRTSTHGDQWTDPAGHHLSSDALSKRSDLVEVL